MGAKTTTLNILICCHITQGGKATDTHSFIGVILSTLFGVTVKLSGTITGSSTAFELTLVPWM
jgi:hypothetical protein